MIDALIEFVMHPGRRALIQQAQGVDDQIVIVEQRALGLVRAIVFELRASQGQQRFGGGGRARGAAAFVGRHQPFGFGRQASCRAGHRLLDTLRAGTRQWLAFFGQESAAPVVKQCGTTGFIRCQERDHRQRFLQIGLRALIQRAERAT